MVVKTAHAQCGRFKFPSRIREVPSGQDMKRTLSRLEIDKVVIKPQHAALCLYTYRLREILSMDRDDIALTEKGELRVKEMTMLRRAEKRTAAADGLAVHDQFEAQMYIQRILTVKVKVRKPCAAASSVL